PRPPGRDAMVGPVAASLDTSPAKIERSPEGDQGEPQHSGRILHLLQLALDREPYFGLRVAILVLWRRTMKRAAMVLSLALLAGACGDEAMVGSEEQGLDSQNGGRPEPEAAGVHWARGQAKPGGGGGSPNLIWHGGPVQHGTAVQAIFWGTSWAEG